MSLGSVVSIELQLAQARTVVSGVGSDANGKEKEYVCMLCFCINRMTTSSYSLPHTLRVMIVDVTSVLAGRAIIIQLLQQCFCGGGTAAARRQSPGAPSGQRNVSNCRVPRVCSRLHPSVYPCLFSPSVTR